MNKSKDGIALFNSGASYIMMSSWFIVMALYIVMYNSISKVTAQYSKLGFSSSAMDDSISEVTGGLWLSVFFFAVSLAAVIFGMSHARNTIKGLRAKSISGIVSTVASAIVWGYASIGSIIMMADAKSSASSSDIIKSFTSAISSEWVMWVIILFEIVATIMAIIGFISVITAPSRAITVDSEEDEKAADPIGRPMSVVQQFAKPEKKDLPPMLNGEQDDSAAASTTANPSISGLRTIAPIEQAAPVANTEPATENTDNNQNVVV